ncbi:hypothetical protein [Wenyingzhuangia sp. IMCC45574]
MNYYTLLILLFVSLYTKGQTLKEGMDVFTNSYAIKYLEPYTDTDNYDVWLPAEPGGSSRYLANPCVENSSVKFKEGVNTSVLENITKLIKEDPNALLPYFDSDEHKIAAFVLFLYTYTLRAEGCSIPAFFDILWILYPDGEIHPDTKKKYPTLTENEIHLISWDDGKKSVQAKKMFQDFLEKKE